MAIKFIKSIDIEVFPAVHRATAYAISKRTTEDNLTKFGKLSSNKDNLSQMFKDPDDSSYVIFNIAGYWFRCLETKIPSGVDINAYIKLTYDDNIGYMLSPIGVDGTLLDVGTTPNKEFIGLAFTEDDVPNNSDGVVYYGLQIRDSVGKPIYQNLKLDASEIRNIVGDDTKHIGEEFDTGTLTAETINGLTIEATTGTLAIANGKTIAVNKSITLAGTDDKTVNAYANLDVGASSTNTGKVTIQSAGSSATTIIGPNDGTTTLLNGEMVEKDAAQKLTQKTFVAPILGAATATSINKVTITPPGTSSVLTIADGKTVAAIANLTVGAAPSNTGGVTIKSSTNNDSTITAPGNGSVTLFAGDMVEKDKIQTLTQKTLTSPILTTPKINDLSSNHRYNIAVSELAADRIITLPLLLGDDEFVFKDFTQTLKNKTLTSPKINTSDINGGTVDSLTSLSIRDTSAAFDVTIAGTSSTALTAGRKLTLDIVNADKTLKLTGSPTLSGITTTGTGTLSLNTNLTVNGANKILAGVGTSLTIDNSLDIAGTTSQITLGTNPYTLAFETTDNTAITLPTTGTLATIDGPESLTNKTINGLSLTSETNGFKISGGTTSKTLTIADTVTIGANVDVAEPVSIQSPLLIDSETIVQADVNIQGDLTINNTTSVGVPFTVGGGSGKTGAVKVYSAGTSLTQIVGPNGGEAKLIAGEYTSSATTDNDVDATPNTLVKRTSNGSIVATSVSANSFNGNATSATNTAFTNTNWASPVAINGTLDESVLGKTLEIGIMRNYSATHFRYYNFGIITLRLWYKDVKWYVGAVYVDGTTYSLTIDSDGAVYFNDGTSRIISSDYKLHYRIIT